MPQDLYSEVDQYLEETLIPPDEALSHALATSRAAGLPEIQVTPSLGRLVGMLASLTGATRALEVGTLGGYSTIWIGRALADGGTLITLEIDPKHAEVARANVDHAGLGDRVDVRLGKAVDTMDAMIAAGDAPFDFIFIDADKPSNPAYLERAIKLSRPGTLIVVDNVIRNGGVADPDSTDPNVIGVREMFAQVASNPRLTATAIQMVGGKGYDGFSLIRVA